MLDVNPPFHGQTVVPSDVVRRCRYLNTHGSFLVRRQRGHPCVGSPLAISMAHTYNYLWQHLLRGVPQMVVGLIQGTCLSNQALDNTEEMTEFGSR